ncbi:MAG TPA: adenine-specific methyltransferase EcoRI family protein [Candidatus Paceibacterota bacterium]|nr:adenine-specific methyltransferase EcoRI family protein [Candidatus Paceibacterota bacterium]
MISRSLNSNLHRAAKVKNDEFYTQLTDIERELKHYKSQFKNKVVYCNCDDPFESNFFKFFAANFNALGLKKLITTSYVKSPIVGKTLPLFDIEGLKPDSRDPYAVEIDEVSDLNNDDAIGIDDVQLLLERNKNATRRLSGDEIYSAGDFRSKECIELLKEADIVVTNPPFSLFRDYVAQLMEHNKKFLIIGNDNAISYKEFFEFVKNNKVWNGYGKVKEFIQPDGTLKKFGNIGWYTNLDTTKRREMLVLYKKYDPKFYVKYDNYDAIEVSKVTDIPLDYGGVMGVPVTFLDKYNPNQFEILGITDRDPNNKYRVKMYTKNDSPKYNDLNRRAAIRVNSELRPTYARLLIKSK